MVFCCDVQDENVFKACASRQNRLMGLAIGNKHACIQGMPVVDDMDAEAIADEILKFKGVVSKKQKDANKNGTLFLKDKNFGYRIAVDPGKYTGLREIWTNSPRTHDKLAADAWIKLQEISCPKCSVFLKLKTSNCETDWGTSQT